jgi:protein-L-isoaspartate(D-aspartate) O-methyltransferase
MIDLDQYRRFFAEEIEAVAKLRTPALVDALATVPRERFLPPGPWTVLSETDVFGGHAFRTVTTPDADPRRVYHNIVVGIDPSRQLFNGQPGTLATWIDRLGLTPGARVLHVGCGLGYYTALLAHAVGSRGKVDAFEVDAELAARAGANLDPMSWVSVRHGDGSAVPVSDGAPFDVVLINAGATHPLDTWLDSLSPHGRLLLPLTATIPAMGPNLGKGLVWQLTKREGWFDAQVVSLVAIYSAHGIRNPALAQQLGRAMMSGPGQWQAVTRLRRDAHDRASSCWFHGDGFCFSR